MLVLKSTLRIGLLTWVALASSIASKVAQSIGPDVIVGAIPGVANYPHVNGIDAFAVGTTSCNIGTAPLNWVSSTNDHPVIAQHAYRLDQGRFEMIGQSWLKHGFVALADSLCGTCQNPGTGSLLGVNCSDPYDASLNGSQNGLGPKFEVDAFTGIYPFPATNLNSSGNSIYKRLQIATTDLSPVLHPGAQFLIEAQYVSKDDAAAGNHFNNA
ncbi:MAG: hypothetical protein KDB53_00115, partial [Planctomycetes bacterium]|nr:hypothetical protein [Planctomycetota bacterium]